MQRLLQSDFFLPAHRAGKSFELDFASDASSGLPLLSEEGEILKVVLTYLALPHSVTEYGCGKKASLILRLLFERGLPAHALSRGMIIERDLSREALDQTDPEKRPHALRAPNPLYWRADLSNTALLELLAEAGVAVDAARNELRAGEFLLQYRKSIQFVHSRSHVFPCLTLWDADRRRAVTRAVDPTIDKAGIFPVGRMRERLGAPEAFMLFAAPLGRFHLAPELLTPKQKAAIGERLPGGRSLEELSWAEQAEILMRLLEAPVGSIGDPHTWTYANNLPSLGLKHHLEQVEKTGSGEGIRDCARRIVAAREAFRETPLDRALEELRERSERLDLKGVLRSDASWSEEQLRPLADLANAVSYHLSLEALAKRAKASGDPVGDLQRQSERRALRGIGVRLRARIDRLARISEDAEGRIDARALNERFIEAACETIRQMNRAALTVFIDTVGNLHGLQLDAEEREALRSGDRSIGSFVEEALCHGSHIDTVYDAGKYDGRLGVLSGIEIAGALRDLERFYAIAPSAACGGRRRLLVSAFMGEEMTFTGQGVSMPGSAAVAGLATSEAIYEMTNALGERLGDRLPGLLCAARERAVQGELQIERPSPDDTSGSLLDAGPDPREFHAPRVVERHLEQGPELDRRGAPLAIAERIMGLRQEDFFISSERAEAAGLEFLRRLRQLNAEERFQGMRVTVGVFRPDADEARRVSPSFGLRWRLAGQADHAGAIPLEERRDAGVAMGMLAHRFLENFKAESAAARPVVGSVSVRPGANRNVAPGLAELTLAVEGPFSEREQTDLLQSLHAYAGAVLADKVASGGAGCSFYGVRAASFLNVARQVRLSLDARAEDAETLQAFEKEVEASWGEALDRFQAQGRREVAQRLEPLNLVSAGVALQLERSYGGSHNPNEAVLADDLLCGSLLQLGAAWDFLRGAPEPDGPVRELSLRRAPEEWVRRAGACTSGALHDSGNFAAAGRPRRSR